MNHGFWNAMAVLWIASCLAFFWTLAARTKEDRGPRICPRRGCRRMPAGTGCNHAAACEGSRARLFTPEED